VHKDSPIQSIADLKGKRVAFKRGSSAHNFTVKALRKAGLGITDIEAADLSPSDAAAAFASKQIDAWSIWDPYFAVAEKDPGTRVLTTAEGIVDSWSYFLSNGDFTAAHGDVLGDILDELGKVGAAAQNDLDGTVAAQGFQPGRYRHARAGGGCLPAGSGRRVLPAADHPETIEG
jgi:sulfonate transport system substrate-binding protein